LSDPFKDLPTIGPKGDLRVRGDKLCIQVAYCTHCEGLTIAPQSDACACGAELYPVTKTVPLGERIQAKDFG
jgi:hypothetical protein